jgi:hypothetical protein
MRLGYVGGGEVDKNADLPFAQTHSPISRSSNSNLPYESKKKFKSSAKLSKGNEGNLKKTSVGEIIV